jgi:hypothetical protein
MRYLTAIFIILAAICKAGADTVQFHFYTSIWKGKDPNFWNPEKSWNHAKKIFAYPMDAWHEFNSGMILCFTLGIIFYMGLTNIKNPWISKGVDLTILSCLFIWVFNLFLNHLFLN